MKKGISNIGLIIISMIFTLQSCFDTVVVDPDPIDGGEGNTMVPITLDLGGIVRTYNTDYSNVTDTAGTSVENAVNDIVVYIFDHTYTCEKILVGTTSPVGPEMIKIGTKHFIAVVNVQANVPALYPPPVTNPSSVSYPALRQQLTDALTALPSSPFLMVGTKMNVPVTEELPITNPKRISIEVERAVAKVTMSFTKSLLATSHTITLQKVTLYKGANKIYLLDKPASDNTTYSLSGSKNTFSPNASVQNSPAYIELADSFYTYAVNAGKDTTNAVRIEIEAAINSPGNIRTAKFFLAEYITGTNDTLYDIRRNYWYDIKVNMTDPGMDSLNVTIYACPWNIADTIKHSEGEGGQFITSKPFKLVKNYTQAEFTANPTFAAIEKHSKGASYIDMTVTSGTPWKLILNPDPENTGRNLGVMGSTDNGLTWHAFPLSGTGDDGTHRVFIYRPYRENDEPALGPSFYVALGSGEKFKESFVIQPRDTLPIPTNSFVLRPQLTMPVNATRAYIPLAGVYSYWENYIMNNDSIPVGTVTAKLVWQDHPTQDVIKNISVIHNGKRDSAYIYAEAGVPGNAVVDMIVGGRRYWSFHLWVTEYNPYEAAGQHLYNVVGADKNVFMDRNLGAMNNKWDANADARGLFYQFGRKDPFPRAAGWTSSSPLWYNSSHVSLGAVAALSQSTLVAATVFRPLNAIPTLLSNPTVFYNPATWTPSTENAHLWNSPGGNKTAFDPCPEGWRIPILDSHLSVQSPWSGATGFIGDTNGYYSQLLGYYPIGGYYSNTNATLNTTEAYYWTSFPGVTAAAADGLGLRLLTGSITPQASIVKSRAVSVRCVVDKKYIQHVANGGLFGIEVNNLKNVLLP